MAQSPERRRAYEIENREKRNRQKNAAKQRRKHERNDHDRELRFRFGRSKGISPYAEIGLFCGNKNDLENPRFIFVHGGMRKYVDTLHDPLPVW